MDRTQDLLGRIRVGDVHARDALIGRYMPVLKGWASGRLPGHARGMADTDDVVQVALMRSLSRLDAFEYRHEGSFLAYLRQAVMNTIRQEVRRANRHPQGGHMDESRADLTASVVEKAIGHQTLERYEEALESLSEDQREAVILRLEFDLSYGEIAELTGRASANAARMFVVRGIVRLAEILRDRLA
jgi:RNA polymerase sigma-70 factor (ECF subfamily)